MAALDELELPQIDLDDAGLNGERWHRLMEVLLADGHWLARAPLATVVLDREAGEFFLRSRSAIFPGMLLAEIFGVDEGPLFEQMKRNIINAEGERHQRLRSLVSPSLTPRAANSYRPAMREILESLWAGLEEAAAAANGGAAPDRTIEIDFMQSIARDYPARTIARVMGAPSEDAPRLHEWSMWIQRQFDPPALADPEALATMQRKAGEFYAWVRPLIEARRSTPSDDLISSLIRAEEEGDRLSDAELENLVLNILVGGVDTTQSQLAQAIRLLSERPEQWKALRQDPEGLAPRAASEALRYEPVTPFTARLLTEDVEYRGITFPADTPLMICSFTGNRDPQAFSRPAEFDLMADRGKARILTFGAGIHYCVGANLARAELEEGLAFFARRIERLEPAGEPELQSVSGIYGLDSLPLLIRPA